MAEETATIGDVWQSCKRRPHGPSARSSLCDRGLAQVGLPVGRRQKACRHSAFRAYVDPACSSEERPPGKSVVNDYVVPKCLPAEPGTVSDTDCQPRRHGLSRDMVAPSGWAQLGRRVRMNRSAQWHAVVRPEYRLICIGDIRKGVWVGSAQGVSPITFNIAGQEHQPDADLVAVRQQIHESRLT